MPARLLIADSSLAMRAVIARAIRIASLAVSDCYQAADAREVLRLIRTHQIDFLLLDTHLVRMEEEKLLPALGAPDTAIPFMVTSVDASSTRIERLLEAGARDYLLKPFSMPTLCARLETALGNLHANN
jgi:DNA-binding response OmpR family regulator